VLRTKSSCEQAAESRSYQKVRSKLRQIIRLSPSLSRRFVFPDSSRGVQEVTKASETQKEFAITLEVGNLSG